MSAIIICRHQLKVIVSFYEVIIFIWSGVHTGVLAGNNRVSVFTCEGVFIKSFGSKRSGQFNCPFGIAVDQCGVVYVSNRGDNRVQIFS